MAILYTISAIGCAFAWNWDALMVARFIGGLGIGGSSVLGPVYIAELAPAKWRGRMVGLFQINIVVGILLAYSRTTSSPRVNLGALQWRWEFGVAIVPSILFLIMLYGIPRSSRWLVTTNRTDEALDVLKLMGSPNSEAELKEIIDSVHLERGTKQEPLFNGKYNAHFACHRPSDCSTSSPASMLSSTTQTTSSLPPGSAPNPLHCKPSA